MTMIYCVFPFFNELDLLELRLRETDGVVDRFVLVESPRTFSNLPKPLHYGENRQRFAPWRGQIDHLVCSCPPGGDDHWRREWHIRAAADHVLASCVDEDVIVLLDADEIPDPEILRREAEALRHGEIVKLNLRSCVYYFNVFDRGPPDSRCRMLTAKTYRELGGVVQAFAATESVRVVPDAGWHFRYTGGGATLHAKLAAFSHAPEFAAVDYNTPEGLQRVIDNLSDLFNLGLDLYVDDDARLPAAVRADPQRWAKHMRAPAHVPTQLTIDAVAALRYVGKSTAPTTNLAVIMPVWLRRPQLLTLTKQALKSIATSELPEPPSVYIVPTDLGVMTMAELDAALRPICKGPLVVATDGLRRLPNSVAGAWNRGIQQAIADGANKIVIMANDVRLDPHTLAALDTFGDDPANANVALWSGRNNRDPQPTGASADVVDFACFMIRPATIERHGLFDARFLPAYFEDNDYYARVILGGQECRTVKAATFYHHGSMTIRVDPDAAAACRTMFERNRQRYHAKWGLHRTVYSREEVLAECYNHPWNDASKPLTWWDRD
jgi:beta-1,4-mannosyl-glycoprotein beta-1,4-N-acetylglucosaminyltransferase